MHTSPVQVYYTSMLMRFFQGFQYALEGLRLAWMKGINFKIQGTCAILALALGWFVGFSPLEYVVVILVISLVLAAETFNTALEELCDKFQPSHDPHIAKIKDLAAAAVLITSFGAGIIGSIMFIPYLW